MADGLESSVEKPVDEDFAEANVEDDSDDEE